MISSYVTGGCGFIGSHLVESLLDKGHHVTVIDNLTSGRIENLSKVLNNSNLNLIQGDIQDKFFLEKNIKTCDYLFHLAAIADIVPSILNPLQYYSTNVTGTMNLLEIARSKSIKKLIYAASSSCYGIPKIYPTPETALINPEYPYALTKWLAEELIMHWSKVYKIPFASLRLFNVYGPRSRTSGTYGAVFGVFLAQKINNSPLTIVGDGNQTRDFTFVTDVVDAFIMVAESDLKNEVLNVGSGGSYSVNYLAKLIGGDTVNIPKRPGEPDHTFADISKIRLLTGWKPKVDFETGVRKVIQNIEYWKDAPLWDKEKINNETKIWFKLLGEQK